MGAQEKFQTFALDERGLFPAICEMMLHSQVQNGRRFLCAMNNIVEHFTSNPANGGDDVCVQIVYVPTCPEWARELLVRFLIHKFAFSTSDRFLNIAKKKTSGPIFLPEKITKRETDYLYGERKYFRKFIKLFEGKIFEKEDAGKSLFVVQQNDVITRKQDKNPWLDQLFSTDIINGTGYVLLTSSQNAHDLEALIRKNRNILPKIENIFIFHSQNRGRITYSFNQDQLRRLNQYGLGIKNCFVFYISERPFRLYYSIDNIKNSLASHLLNKEIKSFDEYDGFITFTPDELDFLFGRQSTSSYYIIDSPDREVFTAEIDSYLDELSHNYRIKNALSLAFSAETQKAFLAECEQETGISQLRFLHPFLNYYRQLWNEEVEGALLRYISRFYRVAIVLPPGIDKVYKSAIKKRFAGDDRVLFIANYEEMRNGIVADLIVLFTFRYTDPKYKTFPNSFDPLPLKSGQRGLTVINRLTHNRYYEWNKHFYEKSFNGLLYSVFRKEVLGWSKKKLQRPIMPEVFNEIEEAEADAREYMAERCTIVFEYGRLKRLAADRVLYKDGQQYCISSLKELPFEEGMEIQMLDDLVEQIKDSLIRKTDSNLKSEGYIRRDPSYGLTQEQIDSDVELWKYILKRKVDLYGVEATYNAIFPVNKEISLRGFERWFDFDYPMILPRSRKSQNSLLKYLGFDLGSAYHRIILTKKLIRNSNTRLLNSQIESLLQSILTVSSVDEKLYEDLLEEHSEILTLLEINSAAEVNTLVELLDITLKPVKQISYDSDKA